MTDQTQTDPTPLDLAHAAMQAAPEDDVARIRFYGVLADTELTLLLNEEAGSDSMSPKLLETADGQFVIAFDLDERLADYAGAETFYAKLPGRALAGMLAGQGVGLALNPGIAASEFFCDSDAVNWLNSVLENTPEVSDAKPTEISKPQKLHEDVLKALEQALTRAQGLAQQAFLVSARYNDDSEALILAFSGAEARAHAALAGAVGAALQFSGIENLRLDVTFPDDGSETLERFKAVGARFDIPEPVSPEPAAAPATPGSDPDRPPILR